MRPMPRLKPGWPSTGANGAGDMAVSNPHVSDSGGLDRCLLESDWHDTGESHSFTNPRLGFGENQADFGGWETTQTAASQLNILHRESSFGKVRGDDPKRKQKHPNKEWRVIQLEVQAGLTISSREERRQDGASSCDKNSDRSLHRPQVQLGERRAGPGETVALCASAAAGGHPRERATSQ